MRTLKRSECAILPLVLKKKWFDMIASGEKREEYREVKPYWTKRIWNWTWHRYRTDKPLVLELRLGYARNAPRLAFTAPVFYDTTGNGDCYYIRETRHHAEWGEPFGPHFVLPLHDPVRLEDSGDE